MRSRSHPFLRSFFASLLAFAVLILLLIGIGAAALHGDEEKIEDGSWLVIDLYGEITEYDPPGGLLAEIVGGSPRTLSRTLDNLDKARYDDRVAGVILKLSAASGAGTAMLEEIRGAVHRLRDSGKPVYGWADSMDRRTFYLASACDSIFIPPPAYIQFTGMAMMSTHVKKTLDKIGVKPNVHKIKDYKSAAELVTREKLSEPAMENRRWLMDEQWAMFMDAIREDRGMSEEEATALMEHALFTSEEAVEGGLADRIAYWDELIDSIEGEDGGAEEESDDDDDDLPLVDEGRYGDVTWKDLDREGKKTIAVVHAEGTIAGRKSKVDPMLGILMGHESVAEDLRAAREDDDVAAIVFRVNSGGGSSLTSDLIARAVEIASAEKPVVVSMVDVAASGGYYIAYRGTRVIADPTTITGSIGSISAKMNISGLHEKLGFTHDTLEKGPMGLIWSSQRDFTDEEWERFTENHWEGFNMWLRDVAEKRGMTFEEAEKLAHGRVWTGRQALANGLIDGIGGMDRAVALARDLAEIPEDEMVNVTHFPKEKGLVESIMSGELDFSYLARVALYHFIRDDLTATWKLLTDGGALLYEETAIR
ncbi:MAG: signal peptide peptidase SppA [Candidatus Eisenbacteria bacterium]|nr:signal peptide peptidase SppA [Candidatus Eisenbacteria bacterium]